MGSKPAFQHWTYAEFERLPGDDGNRYEIIAGELVVNPGPGLQHQEIVGRLHLLLRPFVDAHRLGRVILSPFDVLFAEGDYLAPDLLFVRSERASIVRERGVEGAPDLVVEIVSPSTGFRDRGLKRERYAHYGVAEYWVIDPRAGRIDVYRLLEDAERPAVLTSGTLEWQPVAGGPTLAVDVAELFRGLD
jgi:Uma2 family endonuclease